MTPETGAGRKRGLVAKRSGMFVHEIGQGFFAKVMKKYTSCSGEEISLICTLFPDLWF